MGLFLTLAFVVLMVLLVARNLAAEGRVPELPGQGPQGASALEGDEASVQTRISSAANAAYVQGRADGAVEARAEVSQLTAGAYSRGVSDGERAAMARIEARIRAEREAAYRAGHRQGLLEGQARAARVSPQAARAPTTAHARPRTRAEALRVLELTESATQAEVESRYRELRAAVHPDAIRSKRLPSSLVKYAEEQFKLVGEAYDVLRRG